ncbi:hypothetical protein TPR58_14360 [Sphingomonas sp. HF-S3]|uniref:DUF2721 domain-containing protein n=1 Tax=Sphingomonas rustica TaxID=3103142 RepID=A0ABV0B9V3_9SPHN
MASDRAREQLRQERETFEQARTHVARWFALRLCMGYIGIVLMTLVAAVSTYVILHPDRYDATVLGVAGTALLVDIVSLAVSIFRLVLQQGSIAQLKPVTKCAATTRRRNATDLRP